MSSKKRLIILICLSIAIVGAGYFKKQYRDKMTPVHMEQTLDAQAVTRLEVETTATDIELYPSQDQQIHVEVTGEANRSFADELSLEAKASGHEARIILESPDNFSDVDLSKHRLTIRIPQKVYERIKVSSNLGDLQVKQLKTNELKLSAKQADISAADIIGNEQEYETKVGNISADGVSGKIKAEANQGNVSLTMKEITQDIEVRGDVSEVSLKSGSFPESYRLSLTTDNGEIKTDLSDLQYETKSNEAVIASKGSGGPEIEITTDQGSIWVSKQ